MIISKIPLIQWNIKVRKVLIMDQARRGFVTKIISRLEKAK